MDESTETFGTPDRPVLMTIDNLTKNIKKGCGGYYVWPYEGEYNENGEFVFFGGKVHDGIAEVTCPDSPLYASAHSIATVGLFIKALRKDNLRIFVEQYMTSRGMFVVVVNEFIKDYEAGRFNRH